MKRKLYIIALAILSVVTLPSCEDFLNPESKTNITTDYLTTSPDGLSRAAIGLYALDRELAKGDNGNLYVVTMCDYSTDLLAFRAGTSTALARLETFLTSNGDVESFWQHHYFIIGKANEIIAGAEKLGMDDPLSLRAWGEAKFFRGRAYFELWKRFDRLYLSTTPTTVDNLERDFHPATKDQIFTLIRTDLDDAIGALAWAIPDKDYGRATKATAKHVRAQVAMWDKDYDKVIEECEDIFTEGTMYSMEKKAGDVFNSEDMRSAEVLWSYQFSKNPGGGGSGTPLAGHRAAISTTTRYQSNKDCTFEAKQGGYGWGRVYPNTYLFSLYNQDKDNRYNDLFIHTFYFNDPANAATFGKEIPKDLYEGAAGYMEKLHPMSKKHFDQWTNADQPDRTTSFRDLIVYRLAETYLMCSEAYFHRDGGDSPKAIEYYNETWERAGNDHENGPLTLDMLLDEYARELHFEGVRWSLLKRLGILGERVHLHSGDLKSEDPYLDRDYNECRKNFVIGKHEIWPIPQNQIDLMGADVFPQNDPWK